jgi:hypothetical protein
MVHSNPFLEEPFAPASKEVTALIYTCAREWGRHAVAQRECRWKAREERRAGTGVTRPSSEPAT